MNAGAKTSKSFALCAAALLLCAAAPAVCATRASAERRTVVTTREVASTTRAAASSQTPTEYRASVSKVAAALFDLSAFCERLSKNEKSDVWTRDDSVLDSALELPARQRALFDLVRSRLPERLRVETPAGPVEVDNSWLHASLEEFEKLSDNDKRAEALRPAAQRLRALEARLAEVESAPSSQDKDAERGRLNTILRDPEFNRPPEGNALERLLEDVLGWFSRNAPRTGRGPAPNPRLTLLAQAAVLALCVLVLAYVARRLWSRRAREVKTKKQKRRPRVILGERLEADATPADLLEAAEALARAGDLRGAIRKAYVALLCGLADRGLVGLAQHKTNRDYLEAVRRSATPNVYTEMLPLTRGFEQHWYGLRDATAAEWEDFRTRCRQTLRKSGV